MTVVRRTTRSHCGDTQETGEARHCCRRPQLPEPADPDRALFPRVHATGGIGLNPMTGHAINRTPMPSCGRPGTAARSCSRSTPGKTPPRWECRHEIGSLAVVATIEPSAALSLSPRTLQTYGQDWALFTDWCAATGQSDLARRPRHHPRVPGRLPGDPVDAAVPGCRYRLPPHRGRV